MSLERDPKMKEGTTASRALLWFFSSGDQAVTTLCLALPGTGYVGVGLSDGADNSVTAIC